MQLEEYKNFIMKLGVDPTNKEAIKVLLQNIET